MMDPIVCDECVTKRGGGREEKEERRKSVNKEDPRADSIRLNSLCIDDVTSCDFLSLTLN